MIGQVFLAYAPENQDTVEALALRLRGDARLAFWFAPWHSLPGIPAQEQMEQALLAAQSCAVFVGPGGLIGWQNEQMRVAIQTRIEGDSSYRIIPVLLPGAMQPARRDMPPFLRRYEPVIFHSLDDEQAFRRLLAGILGLPPIQIDGYLQAEMQKAQPLALPSGSFAHGHALVISVANYVHLTPLPEQVLNDARDLRALLTDPRRCGYPEANVTLLLDGDATRDNIRTALAGLADRTQPDETSIVFFSGHGARMQRKDDDNEQP